jgi:hypothetical protein
MHNLRGRRQLIPQKLTKDGSVCISLLDVDVTLQEDRDQFRYLYLALSYQIKKRIENAFYKALTKGLVQRNHDVVVQKKDGINIIQVHVEDVLDNINIIKHSIEIIEEDF